MFKFYKANSKIITKLTLYQFGAAMLGFIMSCAVVQNDGLLLSVSIFSTLFYLILVYLAMWEEGGNERIKIDGGRAEKKPIKGLLISLCANIPNIIFAVILVVCNFLGKGKGNVASEIYVVSNILARFWESMYLGMIQLYFPYNPIAWVLIIIPALLVSIGAYIIGLNNKRILIFMKK